MRHVLLKKKQFNLLMYCFIYFFFHYISLSFCEHYTDIKTKNKMGSTTSTTSTVPTITKEQFEQYKKYFEQLRTVMDSEENYDVEIFIGVKPNFTVIHAHSFILSVHGELFKNILSTTRKRKNGKYIIEIPDISAPVFKTILK
jgi:hypothetical protein